MTVWGCNLVLFGHQHVSCRSRTLTQSFTLLAPPEREKPRHAGRAAGPSSGQGECRCSTSAYSLLGAQPSSLLGMRSQDTPFPRKGSSAPRSPSTPRSEPPPLDVDRARRVWVRAVENHPALQGANRRSMRLVAIQLALSVCYDPRLDEYGQCWPTVPTLAEWCQLSHTGVRKILRRLESLRILATTDRRPMANLYTLDVGVDPWGYCHPVGGRKRGDESTTDIETDILPTGTKPRKTSRLNRDKTLENVLVEPIEPNIKPTRTGKNVFAGSAQMDTSEAAHATCCSAGGFDPGAAV